MGEMFQTQGKIIENRAISPGFWLLRFNAPEIAVAANPGQFVHLLCGGGINSLMRRPISVHGVDRKTGEVYILYQAIGEGTIWLSRRIAGEHLDVLGPLGHGFPLPLADEHIIMVAGGVGVAPLYFLAEQAVESNRKVTFLLGAQNSRLLLRRDALLSLGVELLETTDDGSSGRQGLVTDLLTIVLAGNTTPAAIYTCGPSVMMKKVAGLAEQAGRSCWVSLEERMACGIGACRGCSVTLRADGAGSRYENACTYGPVFDAREVLWP